jgi:hypothetical protein
MMNLISKIFIVTSVLIIGVASLPSLITYAEELSWKTLIIPEYKFEIEYPSHPNLSWRISNFSYIEIYSNDTEVLPLSLTITVTPLNNTEFPTMESFVQHEYSLLNENVSTLENLTSVVYAGINGYTFSYYDFFGPWIYKNIYLIHDDIVYRFHLEGIFYDVQIDTLERMANSIKFYS